MIYFRKRLSTDSKDTIVIITFRRGKTGGLGQVGVNRVCGSIGSRFKTGHFKTGQLGRGSGWVDLYFSNKFFFFFFFFEIDAICQSFMSFSIVIKFSLVILLPITTKHLTPKFGATFVPAF